MIIVKKYTTLPLWIDPNRDPEDEIEMDELTVDELIYRLICGHEITGYIDGKPAGVLNVVEDYTLFFVDEFELFIPDEDFGPDTVLYKGKTIKELLDEDIFYDINVY